MLFETKYEKYAIFYHPTFPLVLFIIPSGWPNSYHVIKENPEDGDYDYCHEFLNSKGIYNRYGIDVNELNI